ncbi:hypothetical protein Tco_0265449 [Tanacetum coccineum]
MRYLVIRHVILREDTQSFSLGNFDKCKIRISIYEMIIKKDSEIVKTKVKRKYIALKAKKESNDEDCLTSGSEDEEYAMAIRDFKKFFKRRDKNQRAFVGGSWSDSGEEDDEKVKYETCLVAHASGEICLGVDLEPDEWIKDSGCSKHMTGNRKLFSTYKAYNGGPDISLVVCHCARASRRLSQKPPLVEALRVLLITLKALPLRIMEPTGNTVIETVIYADSDHG